MESEQFEDLQEVKSIFGITIKPDILISKINIDNYDAIVFVGGGGAKEYFNDSIAHKIVKESIAKGKVLAAICIAPNILANAGVLKDKKPTCFYPKNIIEKGAIYSGKTVEQDGKIITAEDPHVAQDFAKAIIAAVNTE